MFELRPYQQEAVRRTVEHFRGSDEAGVIVLPTGSGKSLVIAELARIARGRVLVLAHVRELVEQNHAKYESYELEADIFSAGLKRKQANRQVVFGSVQSVVRNLDAFSPAPDAPAFTLLVIDECHRVSMEKDASYRKVIAHLRERNPRLKVLGLTATPFRLGQGFIYHRHYHGMVRGDDDCFFRDCVFEQPLRLMVRQGFLSEPRRIDVAVARYDFSQLAPGSAGSFKEEELNEVVQGSRATPGIVLDIVAQARERRGVMVFCSTVEHAEEVTGLLPEGEAALITGTTHGDERERLITAFKAQQLKYLVNVAVLTTGFDAPHVDLIAILRPTESVSLYQQIIGRGLRLSPGKSDCLILDYAGNPWDLYAPEVATPKPAGDTEPVQVECPVCGNANLFWGRKDGDLVIEHFGRRCQGLVEPSALLGAAELGTRLSQATMARRSRPSSWCNVIFATVPRPVRSVVRPMTLPRGIAMLVRLGWWTRMTNCVMRSNCVMHGCCVSAVGSWRRRATGVVCHASRSPTSMRTVLTSRNGLRWKPPHNAMPSGSVFWRVICVRRAVTGRRRTLPRCWRVKRASRRRTSSSAARAVATGRFVTSYLTTLAATGQASRQADSAAVSRSMAGARRPVR